MRRRHQEPSLDAQIQDVEVRLEISAALVAASTEPHDVLQILLDSTDPDAAVPALRERLDISEIGAEAVLDQQFRRATARDRARIRQHHDELVSHLADLRRRAGEAQD